jgi:hypothetical protein
MTTIHLTRPIKPVQQAKAVKLDKAMLDRAAKQDKAAKVQRPLRRVTEARVLNRPCSPLKRALNDVLKPEVTALNVLKDAKK